MTVRQPGPAVPPATDDRARQERIAFDHEHGKLYEALEHAAQLAEMAGHDRMARRLRKERLLVAVEIHDDGCSGDALP